MINITNFGTRVACYSDVSEGESYVMFLTPYQESLSAKYDDIFGATASADDGVVEEILFAMGMFDVVIRNLIIVNIIF